MKEIKLKTLEDSYESGAITKAEYEKQKKEIKSQPDIKPKKTKEPVKDTTVKSDRSLIFGIILLLILFGTIFGIKYFIPEEYPETIEDLHVLNYDGKLKPEQGYLYNGIHSFVNFEDLWYTELASPGGSRIYNIQFRYGPRELEDIEIEGELDLKKFNDAKNYYVTFNPRGRDFSHVALAVADFNQQMTQIFFKEPIAACDRNETFPCISRPIITCDSTEEVVLYIKEADELRVYFDDNCIVVEGTGFDLLKGIDRILLNFYQIMEQ